MKTIALDGRWQFRKTRNTLRRPESIPAWRPAPVPEGTAQKVESWMDATVPGCVHTDLMANRVIDDPFKGRNEFAVEWIDHQDWEYRREFAIDQELLASRTIELVCEGLDTLATVKINGNEVLKTENMFMVYRVDIRKALREGVNELSVLFENPYAYFAERKPLHNYDDGASFGGSIIRKQHSSFSWDWAPSLASMGIFRSMRVEARNHGRIAWVKVDQRHDEWLVELRFEPTLETVGEGATVRYTVSHEGTVVESTTESLIRVQNPQRWWPNGCGNQPLYELRVELVEQGAVVDCVTKRLGLRTIVLDRHTDEWGESFQFLVNGKPVYCKGANWAPPHSFPSAVDRDRYDDLLTAAAAAHMNMVRVWGGGLYEQDSFYELCDEKGIMVWHDFMFACSLYPAYDSFIESITAEAEFQAKRLAHHACMALWCGNNELVYFRKQIAETQTRKDNFNRIFFSLLPQIVQKWSPHIPYWPGSPHSPAGWEHGADSEKGGDAHFYWNAWDTPFVNHAGTDNCYRFCSEFGMQSFPSLETMGPYLEPAERNLSSPVFEAHEKAPGMHLNLVKAIGQRYRSPGDFRSAIYLSQINQAYYLKTAVEHQRRSRPRTMGSLYWQLNDCWPVTSWSSIEFGGRWKALHWAAKRFFAPILVSGKIINREIPGNHGRKTIIPESAELYVTHDGSDPFEASLRWTLYCRDTAVGNGARLVPVRAESSSCVERVSLKPFDVRDRSDLVMRIWLEKDNAVLAENTILFVEPRQMRLSKEKITMAVRTVEPLRAAITCSSPAFAHQVACTVGAYRLRASDNFFDLFPGVPKTVSLVFESEEERARSLPLLAATSCADTH